VNTAAYQTTSDEVAVADGPTRRQPRGTGLVESLLKLDYMPPKRIINTSVSEMDATLPWDDSLEPFQKQLRIEWVSALLFTEIDVKMLKSTRSVRTHVIPVHLAPPPFTGLFKVRHID
jgi:hypothetical protein